MFLAMFALENWSQRITEAENNTECRCVPGDTADYSAAPWAVSLLLFGWDFWHWQIKVLRKICISIHLKIFVCYYFVYEGLYVYKFMCVQVYTHMCAWVHLYVHGGQRSTLTFFSCCLPCFWSRVSYWNMGLTSSAWLAGKFPRVPPVYIQITLRLKMSAAIPIFLHRLGGLTQAPILSKQALKQFDHLPNISSF